MTYMKRKRKNPIHLWTAFLKNQIRIKDIREYIRLHIHANNAWLASHYSMPNTAVSGVYMVIRAGGCGLKAINY